MTTTTLRPALIATLVAALDIHPMAPAAAAEQIPPATPPAIATPTESPAATQAPRPRRYRMVEPTVFPGATVAFPPLGAFVKGPERRAFEPGRTYVLEFFSTTCSHCMEVAPLVAELARIYQAEGFEFISITGEPVEKVRAWLADPAVAEETPQSVAVEVGEAATRLLQFGTNRNSTPSFFIVRDGRVLWIGHPESAEEPLAAIAAGTWDPDSVRADFILEAVIARAREQTSKLARECEKDGRWADLFELFDSIAFTIPSKASMFELQKFGTMIGPAGMPDEGYRYGRELALRYARDLAALRTLARTTLDSPRVRVRDLDFAHAIARAADMLAKGADARAAEILALSHFSRGDREAALEAQRRAIGLETDPKRLAKFEADLRRFETETPGPRPGSSADGAADGAAGGAAAPADARDDPGAKGGAEDPDAG